MFETSSHICQNEELVLHWSRAALVQIVLTCTFMFSKRRNDAMYCSDVSGVFDKVISRRLFANLQARYVPYTILF